MVSWQLNSAEHIGSDAVGVSFACLNGPLKTSCWFYFYFSSFHLSLAGELFFCNFCLPLTFWQLRVSITSIACISALAGGLLSSRRLIGCSLFWMALEGIRLTRMLWFQTNLMCCQLSLYLDKQWINGLILLLTFIVESLISFSFYCSSYNLITFLNRLHRIQKKTMWNFDTSGCPLLFFTFQFMNAWIAFNTFLFIPKWKCSFPFVWCSC